MRGDTVRMRFSQCGMGTSPLLIYEEEEEEEEKNVYLTNDTEKIQIK